MGQITQIEYTQYVLDSREEEFLDPNEYDEEEIEFHEENKVIV